MPTVAVAIGSNIDPERNLSRAAALLQERWPDIRFSGVYRSAPVGFADQADFLNAAAVFASDEDPREIKRALEAIETELKKATPFANGPRTIDLDLLLWADAVLREPGLTIPHPRMHLRRFVLEPLLELLPPEEKHPVLHTPWISLLEATRMQRIERTALRFS